MFSFVNWIAKEHFGLILYLTCTLREILESVVGSGVMINSMWSKTRERETLIYQYIVNHHPMFSGLPKYLDRGANATFEGGDILVLSPQVLAVGISQRSDSSAIKTLARNILNVDSGFEHVLVHHSRATHSAPRHRFYDGRPRHFHDSS